MIPFGLSEQHFVARYRKSLELVSADTINRLRRLFERVVPAEIAEASVEIFLGEDRYAPAFWIYFRGKNQKVDSDDPLIFPGKALDLELQVQRLADFDARYFDAEHFRGNDLAADALKHWFAECWWKAGGWSYAVPTRLSVHDGYGDGVAIKLTEAKP